MAQKEALRLAIHESQSLEKVTRHASLRNIPYRLLKQTRLPKSPTLKLRWNF